MFLDDLEKMFLLHYLRQGRSGLIGEQEKKDIGAILSLNEYKVKEAVLRRVAFLILISSIAMYFVGKTPSSSTTASILTTLISAFTLVFLYLDAAVPVVLFAASASLLAICWMDYQTFVMATWFSALYGLYFFARLRFR
ncbi:hypothetical protein [Mesorhizobium delmotii]|uniref:Uncharacterized protein n=1 Tax=Mesorhizobium delmotii TaxID=1631247 RepID=A0A2P9AKV7_9HYPH|nr:hypothetical protein [Mesorhizobium delmotii]SJM31728.1 conserved membrane hypothetical protein [Mesorhizobium delmotii]